MKAIILVGSTENSWELDTQEGISLYEQLRILPGTMMKLECPEKGYRGISVITGEVEVLTVYKSLVEVVTQDEIRRFMDYNREFEEWLFKTASGKVDDAVFNQLSVQEFK